jgi:acyl-CoA oxidase
VTYEGDNTMLLQQSAKYIMKLYKKVKGGERVTDMFEYINDLPNIHTLKSQANSIEDFCQLSHIETNLKAISLLYIEQTMTKFNESQAPKKQKINMLFATNIVKMALIHIKLINIMASSRKINTIPDPRFREHLHNLTCLMGIIHLQEYASIGFDKGYFQPQSTQWMNEAFKQLLAKIRPQFIPLVEILPYTDNCLCSAIGNSYGDIYETHLEWAKNSRMNKKPHGIQDGFMEYMMPILQGKM